MVKVEMPRGSWETVIIILEEWEAQTRSQFVRALRKEIETQVYSQEY